MDMIKVSANSRTSAVAGAIAGVIRENKHAEVQAIGAGAVNQAVKALVLATSYLKNDGIDVVCMPEFVDVQIDDKVRTAIKLVVEPRDAHRTAGDGHAGRPERRRLAHRHADRRAVSGRPHNDRLRGTRRTRVRRFCPSARVRGLRS